MYSCYLHLGDEELETQGEINKLPGHTVSGRADICILLASFGPWACSHVPCLGDIVTFLGMVRCIVRKQ